MERISENMKTFLNKKNIIIAVVIVCVLGMAAIFFMGGNKEFKNHLSLGNKYLQEMKYEEAIVEFTAAFNLEPKNKEAAEGIENACLAYADSVLADVENVEIETFVKVSEVLMGSYEITQIETIQEKADEIDQVIQEKEAAQAEEEAKAAEENAAEDAKKKEEEQAKKKELEEYYKWKVTQILKGYLFYYDVFCEDKDTEYMLVANGGPTVIEEIVFILNKETEMATITEHLIEDFENGGMEDWSANSSFVGREYNFSSEEGLVLYKEWQLEQERIAKLMDCAIEQVKEHINANWELAGNDSTTFMNKTSYSYSYDEKVGYCNLKYLCGSETNGEEYYFIIEVDLINEKAEIVQLQKQYISDGQYVLWETPSVDFETTIDVVVGE